jgi:glycosyltransferase involved in cell wall biosynthesis
MRILLVSDFYPPTPGGLEAHVQRLAVALLRCGHSVAVVTSTVQPDPLPQGAPVISSPTILSRVPYMFQEKARAFPPPWPDPVLRKAVRSVADTWRPDIIHAHGWCAFSCYWDSSPPLVVSLHDHGLRCPKKSLLRKEAECRDGLGLGCLHCPGGLSVIKRVPMTIALSSHVGRLASHTSQFIAVSRSVADRVGELGIAASKISIVPNFIDVDEQGTPEYSDRPIVLYVGPDSPHKGRSVLVEAFQQLRNGETQLHLVGNGTQIRIPSVHNLGYLDGEDLAAQYRSACVMVVPSIWPEPCPTVILEAMTYGLPIIGSRIGGIPDLVEHGQTGLLVPPNDPTALANCIDRLLDDRQKCAAMGLNARLAVTNFSTRNVVPRIEELYSTAVRTGLRAC